MIKHYDLGNQNVKHTVELVFMAEDYTAIYNVQVSGNSRGLDVIESALDHVVDLLPQTDDEMLYIPLVNRDGKQLFWEDRDRYEVDWLKELLVSARIVECEIR